MKPNHPQTLEQHQKLVMTQELRQSLAVLQMPLAELQAYLAQQLLDNCLLEQEEDRDESRAADESPADRPEEEREADWLEYFADGRDLGVPAGEAPGGRGAAPEDLAGSPPSLQEHLLAQLSLVDLAEEARWIGEFLVGSLNGDGYLGCTIEECAAALGVNSREVEKTLAVVQALEPPGVGARDLRECLLLQLGSAEGFTDETRSLAVAVVEHCLDDLATGGAARIARKLRQPEPPVQAALDLIRRLDPKPGRNFGPADPGYLIPDVTVRCLDGDCLVTVNEGSTAEFRLNPVYQKMLAGGQAADRETLAYLRDRLRAATALIRSVEQRRTTLSRVAAAIVDLQKPFFTKRAAPLRPLTLRLVAEAVGLHESTVSRATAGKYLETPRGIFGFRHFFGAGLRRREGEAVSAWDVKRLIRETLACDKDGNGMSDAQLAAELQGLGIRIARRTVAKYREELGIPPASRRER